MTTVSQSSATQVTGPVTLLIATRKGTRFLKGGHCRRSLAIEGPVLRSRATSVPPAHLVAR